MNQASIDYGYDLMHRSRVVDPISSIIVPLFNASSSGYYEDLVESIVNQDAERLEFVLVDDCSTDDTAEKIKGFAESSENISAVKLHRNMRQGGARNVGIQLSKGAYIGFLDSDDVVDRGYYTILQEKALEYDADIAMGPVIITDEELNESGQPAYPEPIGYTGLISREIRDELILHPTRVFCCLYRKGFLHKHLIRFPEGVFFEDNVFCFKAVLHAKKVACLSREDSRALYRYRQHGRSTDHRTDIAQTIVENRLETSSLILEHAKEQTDMFERHSDAIELYFVRLNLLNTLGKIWSVGSSSQFDCRVISSQTRREIKPLLENKVFLKLPFSKRAQVVIALYSPKVYMALLSLSSLFGLAKG